MLWEFFILTVICGRLPERNFLIHSKFFSCHAITFQADNLNIMWDRIKSFAFICTYNRNLFSFVCNFVTSGQNHSRSVIVDLFIKNPCCYVLIMLLNSTRYRNFSYGVKAPKACHEQKPTLTSVRRYLVNALRISYAFNIFDKKLKSFD